MYSDRVLSGMRPTGRLHLGHYHGVLKNWLRLQHEYQCLFFVADWHALTTHYDTPQAIDENVRDMTIDWLAAGVDPAQATLFVQSRVIEHAELHLLLSMMTPLGWLERVPTYKDQQEKLSEKDLSTYGFLGYPLLQSADILIYRANRVPVGEDQVPHIEFTREICRRFNHLYGREPGFEEKARAAVKKLGSKKARLYEECRTAYQEKGDDEALESAKALLNDAQNLSMNDRERLFGYLEGSGKMILVEPEALLTEASKMPGLDGQKMSKSYNNTIALREDPEVITKKIRTMPTDPARVRRTDPGNPAKCPVWQFHLVYSDDATRQWVTAGCTSAGIGCLDCKQPVIDAVLAELAPIRERAAYYEENPDQVRNILADGCEKAQELARDTMRDVREAMGLTFG
ncbi:MAG TPA: tryptophan--tRNA ligase [Thiobacillus sp.]|nr:tryptophan--tRNA ligase [Gammaproteobacteria bacterium]OYZ27401.1 MAG: tryptophan--tRNA ligase [Hydrogenophilales bacterium 16-64-40]OZA32811.1 MAG: tryptophan--tRNA ligase [Hydrogenophilales bacterium 17-64-65]HQS81498.1 tryptophan--tRNA ligase [Thiobacillus sp.]HQT34520.1 tryptophan--tRNA ligase [Thiobacillus sp.]